MQRIINTQTKTIHKPRDEQDSDTAECGSLKHVPRGRTRIVSDDAIRTEDAVDRCGSCFEDAGGY